MLPNYLNPDYLKKLENASSELLQNQPTFIQTQIKAGQEAQKMQMKKEAECRAAFDKRSAEVGLAQAIFEQKLKTDSAIAEAKLALEQAIVYTK